MAVMGLPPFPSPDTHQEVLMFSQLKDLLGDLRRITNSKASLRVIMASDEIARVEVKWDKIDYYETVLLSSWGSPNFDETLFWEWRKHFLERVKLVAIGRSNGRLSKKS